MKGYVTVPLLNVRIKRGGRVVGRLKQNEIVKVFEQDGDWTEVEYKGVPRMVMTRYLVFRDDYEKFTIGKVNVRALNVRQKPEGKKVGLVKKNEVVYIQEEKGEWVKIPYRGNEAWVVKKFLDIEEVAEIKETKPKDKETHKSTESNEVILTGIISASVLNVRSKPEGDVIGGLKRGTKVEIMGEDDKHYRINYNNANGYVSTKFVNIVQGTITATILNVRDEPKGTKVLGKLKKGDKINIIDIVKEKGNWVKFIYNKQTAYVSADFVRTDAGSTPQPIIKINFLHTRKDLKKVQLEPTSKLEVTGSKEQKTGAAIYNQYGNLLQVLSKELNIEIASAVAVLCVESGGHGFGSDGKMIIRFENHLFYNFWGKHNKAQFDKHFKFNPAKRWLGHYFRTKPRGEWIEQHAKDAQKREWEVLEFAREFDDTKALYSISMGAPQVMGFNHKIIGYDTVQEMFDKFNDGIYYHIAALFDFCKARSVRIEYLKKKDFVSFAREYNGPGQPTKYGRWMKSYYDAFPLK